MKWTGLAIGLIAIAAIGVYQFSGNSDVSQSADRLKERNARLDQFNQKRLSLFGDESCKDVIVACENAGFFDGGKIDGKGMLACFADIFSPTPSGEIVVQGEEQFHVCKAKYQTFLEDKKSIFSQAGLGGMIPSGGMGMRGGMGMGMRGGTGMGMGMRGGMGMRAMPEENSDEEMDSFSEDEEV